MTQSKPSKSERKREARARQALGEQLVELNDEQLDSLALDERLLEAIADLRRMKSHEAQRRQKQYIGKLMADVDPAPIRTLFDRLRADDRRAKRLFADAERWRDRLVSNSGESLAAFETMTGRPQAELAALLVELGNANSDRAEKTLRRQVFRQIHDALAARTADG